MLCCIICCTILFRWWTSCLTSYVHSSSLTLVKGLSSLLFNSSDMSSSFPAFIALRTIVPARRRLSLSRDRANSSLYGASSVQLSPSCSAVAASLSKLFAYIFFWLRRTLSSCFRNLVHPSKPTVCLESSYHRLLSSIACRLRWLLPLFLR